MLGLCPQHLVKSLLVLCHPSFPQQVMRPMCSTCRTFLFVFFTLISTGFTRSPGYLLGPPSVFFLLCRPSWNDRKMLLLGTQHRSSEVFGDWQDSLEIVGTHQSTSPFIQTCRISSGPSQDSFELVRTFRNSLEPFKTFQDSSELL